MSNRHRGITSLCHQKKRHRLTNNHATTDNNRFFARCLYACRSKKPHAACRGTWHKSGRIFESQFECQFRAGIDALQLYVSVLSLSYLHLSNRHTLSATYGQDMAQKDWLDERRDHVTEMVLVFCGAKS